VGPQGGGARDRMLVYGPNKSSSLTSTEGGFISTVSMASSGEKLGTVLCIDQSSCCVLCLELFFSEAVALSITIDDFTKGCYMWTT
jgi:hypothetical protein